MSATTLRTPSYRHHKPSGQAVVTLDGRDIYLGRYGTPQSRAEFDRLLAEWLSNGRRLPAPTSANGSDLSVNELAVAYLAFADGYYTKRGKPTTEPEMYPIDDPTSPPTLRPYAGPGVRASPTQSGSPGDD